MGTYADKIFESLKKEKYSDRVFNQINQELIIYADKFKSANNLDDIVLASTNYINEDLKHSRKDKFTEFARGDVLIRVGDNDYSAKVIVGFTSGKQMVLYDVIDFSPTSFELKKTDMRSPSNRINAENGSNISVSNSTIPQEPSGVNTSISKNAENDTKNSQFSLSDDYDNAVEQYGAIPPGENPACVSYSERNRPENKRKSENHRSRRKSKKSYVKCKFGGRNGCN